ncbi:TIGR04452 family lipoprotein [Leptospira vanthielii]|uniref:Putative lipoprotein n=1 Tax=Leptospira vanthielii serovar Holland str. Waz Holland = ATCC 700522 TaxID=1218591 RepID=N1W934_9LEPT|nr:TIGR04452 family lipoprotein [Leptospira vanthielii]EMY69717.1 putative lipoprotein [Leptospira vanthielii serovar Holland str. Waz Holland = ATCC 700522]
MSKNAGYMRKVLFLGMIFAFISCSEIYSPMGVKGKDAKKQIRDLNSNLDLLSLPLLLSSASSAGSSSSSSSFVCPTDPNAILGSANDNTSANFTLPAANNYVDLDAKAGGTLYFRSNVSAPNTTYMLKVLQTANTSSTASCTYTVSAGVCAGAIVAGLTLTSTTTADSPSSCLAIRCTTAAYIRILATTTASTTPSSVSSSFLSFLIAPEIQKSVSGIEDDKYYTKESLDKCKEGLTNISLLQTAILSSSFGNVREVSFCNKPLSIISSGLDGNGTAALKGNECKLEEVNLLGF